MKLLFTADIHIKLGQKNVPVDWAKNRFEMFVDQLAEMQKQADLVIIGGDIFDRLPTMDEIALYFDFVERFTKPTIIYSGNHEMLKKDTTFLSYLKRSTNRLNPLVTVVDAYVSDGVVDIIPYNKLKDFQANPVKLNSRILCTHVRGEIPPHVKPEVPLELFDSWDVVLAGDLHSYDNCQRNILYPGSPYTTSFHRNQVDTGAILLDTDTLEHTWLKFNLPQLIKLTVQAGEETPATSFDHTIYEVEGDLSKLKQLESNDLVAKKVVKRNQDTALILDPEMSLAEEVKEYLQFILELDDSTTQTVLGTLLKHLHNIEQ